MLDPTIDTKRETRPNLPENERIKKLREKLSTAQRNLRSPDNPYNNDRKLSHLIEEARSPSKPVRDLLSEITNIHGSDPTSAEQENNKYSNYLSRKGLAIEDLETAKLTSLDNELRNRTLERVLHKMESYKVNPFDSKALVDTFSRSSRLKTSLYYNFAEEENTSALKYLISLLYQELENLCQSRSHEEGEYNSTYEKNLHRSATLNKSHSPSVVDKGLLAKRYSSCDIIEDNTGKGQTLLTELKEYFRTVNQGPLAEQLMKNYFDMTRSIREKLDGFEVNVSAHQSTQPCSFVDLFKRNASESKDYNRKHETAISHSKSMVESSDNKDKRVGELLCQVKELQRENEDIRRQSISMVRGSFDKSSKDNTLLMDELKKALQSKEEAETECESLKRTLKNLENQLSEMTENQIQANRESLTQIDSELKRARCQIVSLLDQKAVVEKKAFQFKVDNDDLLDQLQALEFKLNDLVNQKEMLKTHIMTHENTIREKTAEIQRLNFEKAELEGRYSVLRKHEKEYDHNIKQVEKLEGNINILREELTNTRNALAEAEEMASTLQKEKDIIIAKCETLENFDPRNVDPRSLEQIAIIIFSRLTQSKEMNNDLKNKLQKIFGDKFVYLLGSLKKRLKRAEGLVKEYRKKYQEKVNVSVDKTHEVENLSSLLLQVQESLPRTVDNPKLASLVLLKDELERKRGSLVENINKAERDREADLSELTKLSEEPEDIKDEPFNETATSDPDGGFPTDLGNLIEENATLKAKIQDQSNEISNLNAQLKFANSVGETRRKNTAAKTGYTANKLGRSSREYTNNKDIDCDEEEETQKAIQQLAKNDDFYLMLRAQASSLELLLSNEI